MRSRVTADSGRSPGLRVSALDHLPRTFRFQWCTVESSPFTVAGAAADCPRSLLIPCGNHCRICGSACANRQASTDRRAVQQRSRRCSLIASLTVFHFLGNEFFQLLVAFFLRGRHAESGAQDPTHFFFHRPAVLGGANPQLPFQLVVDSADQEGGHGAENIGGGWFDINDIIDIEGWRGFWDDAPLVQAGQRFRCPRILGFGGYYQRSKTRSPV
jgi:hypothetical protein